VLLVLLLVLVLLVQRVLLLQLLTWLLKHCGHAATVAAAASIRGSAV
jgi:hypothetical protein